MNHELQLHNALMSRVQTIRGVRVIIASPAVSFFAGVVLVFCLSIIVSLGDVLANTMAYVNWAERFSYALSSLLHSRIIVQTLAALTIIACFGVFVNSIRSARNMKWFAFGSTQRV